MSIAHVKIIPQQREGKPHIVLSDKIIAVLDDGTELDFSSSVTAWTLVSKVGEIRLLELTIMANVVETTEIVADVPEPKEEP